MNVDRAYKFLAKGALSPFSGFGWPQPAGSEPGAWVEVNGELGLCARGIHVCRPEDLAYWLHDELWEVETGGETLEGLDCLVVRRARLLRRIDGWNEGGSVRFAEACVEHVTSFVGSSDVGPSEGAVIHELLDDATQAVRYGYPAVSAFTAALVASKLAGELDTKFAFRVQRAWQANWIARELIAPSAS